MECNKEEALLAKEISLRKLKTKDFLGAKRIALKAQRLNPKLQNLSQLLAICEVHCAAEAKVNGDMDWYAILQVEKTVNATVIRKEYEKLSFLLHPGKNTLPGAQAAFKLVSEAHTILCDHVKRSQYDIKRQCGAQEMSRETTWLSDKTRASKSDVAEHMPPSDFIIVFWTICPHCRKRFVYYQRNFLIRCDDCSKNFFAFKLHEEAVPSRFLVAAPSNCQVSSGMFSRQKHGVCNPQVQYSKLYKTWGNVDSEPTMHARQSDEHAERDCRSDGDQEGSCTEMRSEVVESSAINLIHSPAPSVNKCTTSRMVPDPPDSYFVATQNISREDASTMLSAAGSDSLERSGKRKQDDGANNSHIRDSCNKRVKKYNSLSNADSGDNKISSNNVAGSDSQSAENLLNKVDIEGDGNEMHESNSNSSDEKICNDNVAGADCQSTEYCPSKVDSQTDRNANYNDHKMFNYSVADVDDLSAEHLSSKVYVQGDGTLEGSLNTGDDVMFNGNVSSFNNQSAEHLPSNCQVDGNVTHDCVASSGDSETFNDIAASADNQTAEYLSSTVNSQGDGKGTQEENTTSGDGKMFSDNIAGSNNQSSEHHHRKMGSQGDGNATHECNANSDTVGDQGNITSEATDAIDEKSCYSGCLSLLELDTTSLPTDLDAAFPSVTLDSYKPGSTMFLGLRTDSMNGGIDPGTEGIALEKNHCEENLPMENHNHISAEQDTSSQENAHGANDFGDSAQHNCLPPGTFSYPASAFYNFDELRSHDKFECGQIWALYSDADEFPNFYGQVREVETDPFKVHLTWLEACRQKEQEEQWWEQGIGISCGTFQVRDWKIMYDTNDVFSHVVHAKKTSNKWQFKIHPQVGEIWAIYMNWSPDWAPSSSNRAEYAIGEIKRRTKSSTIFEFLTKVDGHVALFKPDDQRATLKIPLKENLRFSHRIPSFCLTEENGGELCGFYELDPASVPRVFL